MTNNQESYMMQVLSQPGNYQPRSIMAALSMGRWLSVSEIESLLDHESSVLAISTAPASTPPVSGTLLLFNRSVTRNYKDDGHQWIRKRNSNKVREDHVKLRVGGKFRVSGCYVHSSSVPTFHRRAYHLLNPDSGTALYPVTNASKAGKNNLPPSLILVHYLDTNIASSHCATLVQRGVDINPTLYPNLSHSQSGIASKKELNAIHQGYSLPQPQPQPQAQMSYNGDGMRMQPSFQHNQNHHQQHHNQSEMYVSNEGNQDPQHPEMYVSNEGNQDPQHPEMHISNEGNQDPQHPEMCISNEGNQDELDYPLNYQVDGNDADDKAIDFLWDVVVEEGNNNNIQMHSSNLSDMLTPELIDKMFDSELVGSLFEHGELFRIGQSEMEVDSTLSNQTENLTKEKLQSLNDSQNNAKSAELTFGQAASISNIVDVTPETFSLDVGSVKVVVSLSDICPSTIDDTEEQFVWKRLICFVECPPAGANPRVAKTVEAKMLNPYCYQCTVPERSMESGSYKVMIVAVKLSAGVHHSQSKITGVVCRAMEAISQSCPSLLPSKYHSVTFEGIELKIMTQLSSTRIKTMTTSLCDHNSMHSTNSSGIMRNDLPAPPPAMALVATMLSDFPNPPPGAVLPPDSVITTHPHSEVENGTTFEEANENTLNNVEVNKIFSNAIEATVVGTKKRRNSVIEIPRSNVSFSDLGDAPSAAGQWAAQMSTDLESDTKADAVDRHCKIRFVERLTCVISEAGGDELVKETLPQSITTTKEGHGNALTVDRDEMKALEDNDLDRILDMLLVRIVESLVEMSPSECDLQEELNAPDGSGFTLLHYAALYNLQSLIPVLLSRGATPDVKSSRGDVTPLHLACGAGNTAIVELLLRQGCAMEVADCFGSFPADHALRNGFHSLAALLQERILNEKGIKAESSQHRLHDEASQKKQLKEYEKMRLQEAFANLSLRDKLALNIHFKTRMNSKNIRKTSLSCGENGTIAEVDIESDSGIEMNNDSDENDEDMKNGDKSLSDDESNSGSDDLSSVITDTDKGSLDIAMKLMNAKELEDLEKSAGIQQGLKTWMLQRNYESLKEASEHLQKTIQEHKARGGETSFDITGNLSPTTVEITSESYAQKAAIRSLKNVKEQAIAGLVLRKNLKDSLKEKPSKHL